jgi:hypothetical protein
MAPVDIFLLNIRSDMDNLRFYEFIQASDKITFKAPNNEVAFCCAVMLGEGLCGCHEVTESGEKIKSLRTSLAFEDPEIETKALMDKGAGGDFNEFCYKNQQAIRDAFATFCYGSVQDRTTFDEACKNIADPEKLNQFKNKHEDENRTSTIKWVRNAWVFSRDMAIKESREVEG